MQHHADAAPPPSSSPANQALHVGVPSWQLCPVVYNVLPVSHDHLQLEQWRVYKQQQMQHLLAHLPLQPAEDHSSFAIFCPPGVYVNDILTLQQ